MIPLIDNLNFQIRDVTFRWVIMPSGSFGQPAEPLVPSTTEDLISYTSSGISFSNKDLICNPFKIPSVTVPSQLIDQIPIESLDHFLSAHGGEECRIVNSRDIEQYGDSLVKLGKDILQHSAQCYIVPLRGGMKPAFQLRTMGVISEPVEFLPFTQGSSGKYDNLILEELTRILSIHLFNEHVTVNILDTAKGGHGCVSLAKLIKKTVLQFRNHHWTVRFFLLHPMAYDLLSTDAVKQLSDESIEFYVLKYPVDDLLVEDWDAAIGLKVSHQGSDLLIKPSITEGRLIYVQRDKVALIESSQMNDLMDVIIANAISESMRTDPRLIFYRDVWQEYTTR